MKRLMLLLPLVATACGDDTRAKLDQCKDEIRAELTALLEETKRDAAESIEVLESAQPAEHRQAREAADAIKRSNETIKAVPDMFAAMAVPMVEAQLQALEPTPAGLAKCEGLLAEARQK